MEEKIQKSGFYCGCDTVYFDTMAKFLGNSIRRNAPWAHVHFHVFDGTNQNWQWCLDQGFTYSSETTPANYQDLEEKKVYWVSARFIRLSEIYHDLTRVIALDADSILVKPLSYDQFDRDMQHSWITVAVLPTRPDRSLASAVGFSQDSARHVLARRLQYRIDQSKSTWFSDQHTMNQLLEQGVLQEQDYRIYSDFEFTDRSYIWTAKGKLKSHPKFLEKQTLYSN